MLLIFFGVAAQDSQPAAKEQNERASATEEQKRQFAVTAFSASYLRTAPNYESALETQELMGTVVEVTGQKGYWRQVTTPQPYTAWCTDLGLAFMSETETAEYIAAPKYIYTSLYGHVYSKPSIQSDHVCDLVAGDLLRIVLKDRTGRYVNMPDGKPDGIVRATGNKSTGNSSGTGNKGTGMTGKRPQGTGSGTGKASVKGEWAEVMLPSGKTGFVPAREMQEFRQWAMSGEATVENIIRTAKLFTGVPYLWGGMSSKGLDCSGLTRLTWFLNGVLLPRNASQQVHTGDDVPVDPDPSYRAGSDGLKSEMLRRVRNLQAGDLVFFGTPAEAGADSEGTTKDRITHVGIYIGNNHIIHSSHTVRINSLIPGDEDYYENSHRLIRARRIIGQEDCGKGIVSIKNSPAYF